MTKRVFDVYTWEELPEEVRAEVRKERRSQIQQSQEFLDTIMLAVAEHLKEYGYPSENLRWEREKEKVFFYGTLTRQDLHQVWTRNRERLGEPPSKEIQARLTVKIIPNRDDRHADVVPYGSSFHEAAKTYPGLLEVIRDEATTLRNQMHQVAAHLWADMLRDDILDRQITDQKWYFLRNGLSLGADFSALSQPKIPLWMRLIRIFKRGN